MTTSGAVGALLPLSADWFRALAETTATAIFVYGLERFHYVNRAAEELTGYSAAELYAMHPDALVLPEYQPAAHASRARRIAGDPTPARFELGIRRKDGEPRWLLFSAALIEWSGAPAGLGSATDITDRIRADRDLRRQVQFEQAVAEVTRVFLQLPPTQLSRGVEYAFARLGPLVGVDRAQLFLMTADGAAARCAGRWTAGGGSASRLVEPVLPVEGYRWAEQHLRRGGPVVIEDAAQLPADAGAERELCRRFRIRAAALVPLGAGQGLAGFLSFESLSATRAWSADLLGMLAILAEVFNGALERQRAELALTSSQRRLQLAQLAGRSIVWEWEVDSDQMYLPPVSLELFGVPASEVPRSGAEMMRFIPEEDQAAIHDALRHTLRTGASYILEHRVVTPAGDVRWLAVRGQLVPEGPGRRILGVSTDVTEHRLAEQALQAEQERAQVTLASIADGVVRTDAAGRVEYLNPVAETLTGWTTAEARGRPLIEIYQVVDDATGQPRANPVERCLREGQVVVPSGHSRLLRRDGEAFAVRDSAAPIRDAGGQVSGAVLVVQDVTQLRGLEREMIYLARHDALTGLVNRRELERHLEGAIATARDDDRRHALCYMDLDEFKLVNDTCGHVAGDELLRQLTALLGTQVRDSDVLARLGGDEFGVLLRDCALEGAMAVAEKLRRTVRGFRFTWEDRVFDVGVSVGVVPITAESESLAQVLSAADAACYVAKEQGRNRVHLYQPDDRAVAQRYGEMQWVQRINRGFEDGRFRLYRQVIRPLHGDGQEMSEILLRLEGEDGQLMPTPAIIAAAERYHLISGLDRWVVEAALARIAELGGSGVFTLNLSGQSLGDPAFLEFVLQRVGTGNVAPRRLCFEITETATIANLARARQLILRLKELGCRFVLDDFGTGLSSFAYLQSLPVDFLKIDGEFVRHLPTDPVQRALVGSIHHVGHLMGLRTIGEAVESEAALRVLQEIGVDYAQGYWIGMPEAL